MYYFNMKFTYFYKLYKFRLLSDMIFKPFFSVGYAQDPSVDEVKTVIVGDSTKAEEMQG